MKTKKNKRKAFKTILLSLTALLVAGGLFAAGFVSGRSSREESAPAEMTCTVRYLVDGKVYESEESRPGDKLRGVGYPELEKVSVLGWQDANGQLVEPADYIAYTDMDFTARTAPALERKGGYMPCANGLFRPESPLTSDEALEIFRVLSVSEPDEALFEKKAAYTADEFAALLENFFRAEKVAPAVDRIRGIGSLYVALLGHEVQDEVPPLLGYVVGVVACAFRLLIPGGFADCIVLLLVVIADGVEGIIIDVLYLLIAFRVFGDQGI